MYLFVCFCFFKQKTAYEMRISDCSSDVFSSDLFWCVEAVYKDRDGVLSVASGYAGGSADTADYKTVCTGQTEHAEVIQIAYDPARTSFGKLLKIFFAVAHDPTQLNRQGNDVGAQRSEEHTSELQSLMRLSYAVFCLKKKHTILNT